MNPLVHLAILSSIQVQDTPERARRRAMLARLQDDARRERSERRRDRYHRVFRAAASVRRAWTVVVGSTA